MKVFIIPKLTITFLFLLLLKLSDGQENIDYNLIYKESESFFNLPEGVIKNEIACINFKSSYGLKKHSKISLNEIPVLKCTDSTAYFENGNIISSEITVSIKSKNIDQKSILKGVFYNRYKYCFWLPDSAVNDILNPRFCHKFSKRNKPIINDCKVYQSEDRKRIYIYMLNGDSENSYEVIWIIQDDEYVGRVIAVCD